MIASARRVLDRDEREERRALLVTEWSQAALGEPAAPHARLDAEDWNDLRTWVELPVCAATVVAAHTNDPDTAALPDYSDVEARALDVLLATDPGELTRPHRTLVVTAAMQFTMIDGEPVEPAVTPLDDKRAQVAKHVLDWTTANGML